MKKKIFVIVLVCSLLFISSGRVYAQSVNFPKNPVALEYSDYYFLQENAYTFEYMVAFYLHFPTLVIDHDMSDFVFVNNVHEVFRSGLNRNTNSFEYFEHVVEVDKTRYTFRFTIRKTFVDSINGDIEGFFENNAVMYVESDYTAPDKVMSNFFGVELSGEPQENELYGELWYMYFGINVYLPDGTQEDISEVGHLIRTFSPMFDGYDFVVYVFNFSPRAVFMSSSLSPTIEGLSYIVYDIVGYRTLFYNYAGVEVYRVDGIIDIVNPRLRLPASDDLNYRERLSYEKGKADGVEIGKEQGYNEGYGKGYNAGYIKGKNDAHFEDLDLFAYLQALFGEQGLGRLLKLELLPGVSLGAVIMIPLAFWLVSFIMRWFR